MKFFFNFFWVARCVEKFVVYAETPRTGPYLYTKRFDDNFVKLTIPEGTLIRVTFTAELESSSLGNNFDFYIHCGPTDGLKCIADQSTSEVEYRYNRKGDGGKLYKGVIAEGYSKRQRIVKKTGAGSIQRLSLVKMLRI